MKEDILEQFPILLHVWGPKLLMALLLLAIFWFASRMVRQAIFAAGTKADLEYPVVRLMAMAARVTLLVAGIVTALGTVGVVAEASMNPWDFMALIPVIEGAGGRVTDWAGEPLTLESDGTVLAAATPALHQAALHILND